MRISITKRLALSIIRIWKSAQAPIILCLNVTKLKNENVYKDYKKTNAFLPLSIFENQLRLPYV